jgi:hypothetical protein
MAKLYRGDCELQGGKLLRLLSQAATKPVSPAPLVLTEEEKREREADLERIADQLVATLNAACCVKLSKIICVFCLIYIVFIICMISKCGH